MAVKKGRIYQIYLRARKEDHTVFRLSLSSTRYTVSKLPSYGPYVYTYQSMKFELW